MEVIAGTRIADRYVIERALAKGGMGAVFVAFDEQMGVKVALKVTAAGGAAADELARRFAREARIGNRLGARHQGFVRSLGWGRLDAVQLYLVMDLIEGGKPLDLRSGALEERLDRWRRAADLVGFAHEQGVIHRDLKPANFLQAPSGAIYLTDFGLAKVVGDATDDSVEHVSLTATGVGFGTPPYMPPEQLEDAKHTDERADVYALGCMLFEAAVKRLPYPGPSATAVMGAHFKVRAGVLPPPRPGGVEPSVPDIVDQACAFALELDVERRCPSVAMLLEKLDEQTTTRLEQPQPLSVGALATTSPDALPTGIERAHAPSVPLVEPAVSRLPTGAAVPTIVPQLLESTGTTPAPGASPMVPAGGPRRAALVAVALLLTIGAIADDLSGLWRQLTGVAATSPHGTAERLRGTERRVGTPSHSATEPRPETQATEALSRGTPFHSEPGPETQASEALSRVDPVTPIELEVTLTEPPDGAWMSTSSVRVAGRVSTPLPLDQVEVRLAGMATPLRPDGTFEAILRLNEGAHDLEVKATARTPSGPVEGRAVRQVGVDLTPPAMRVLGPRDGATTSEETVTLEVEVTDQSPWVDVTLSGPVQINRRVHRGELLREAVRLPSGTCVLSLGATDVARNAASEIRVRLTRETAVQGIWPNGPASLPPGVRLGEHAGEYVNEKDGTVLVWIPPGAFRMGSDSGDSDEKPVRQVRFAQGFFLGKHETTWGQYLAFCKATGRAEPLRPSLQTDDRHPVVNVSWEDVVDYCRWAGLRLPSEAEWEYGCRAGSTGAYCYGDEESRLGEFAWFDANAGTATHAVGEKLPNAWGLHDVHGNVWEWVHDTYRGSYSGAPTDGRATEAGSYGRVGRGGSWSYGAGSCRAANRNWNAPGYRNGNLGFRPAR